MKLKYKISLIVIISLLALTSTLATSYSLWTITESQTGMNEIVAGCFDISFNDLDLNNQSTSINLNNTYPISNEKGLKQRPYVVKIKNNCNVAANYNLLLADLESNTLDTDYINYALTSDGVTYGPYELANNNPYSLNNSVKGRIEREKSVQINNSYILNSGILNPQEDKTYELRLWVKESATDIMEQEFGAVVFYEAYAANPHP